MSDKPDYYKVLDVDKKATKAEIQVAYKKIAMKNHPDMVKNKPWPQAQKDEAIALFKNATEAEGILSDDLKRTTYDQYGHKGLENLAAGKSGASGRTYEEVAGPRLKRTYSEDDTFSFFEKKREQGDRETKPDDGLTPEQRRAKAREERLAKRNRGGDESTTPTVKEPFDNASSTNVFRDVTDNIRDASEGLKSGVTVPFDVLEKFRDNLQDFVREVDKAIARARPPGPKRT